MSKKNNYGRLWKRHNYYETKTLQAIDIRTQKGECDSEGIPNENLKVLKDGTRTWSF